MYRTVFWTLQERERVGWFGRMALKHVKYHIWNESPVQVRCTILDAWGWCTGTTQRDGTGREEGSGWGTRVYLWQIHVDIWQNQFNSVKLKNKIKYGTLIENLRYCKANRRGENCHWKGAWLLIVPEGRSTTCHRELPWKASGWLQARQGAEPEGKRPYIGFFRKEWVRRGKQASSWLVWIISADPGAQEPPLAVWHRLREIRLAGWWLREQAPDRRGAPGLDSRRVASVWKVYLQVSYSLSLGTGDPCRGALHSLQGPSCQSIRNTENQRHGTYNYLDGQAVWHHCISDFTNGDNEILFSTLKQMQRYIKNIKSI